MTKSAESYKPELILHVGLPKTGTSAIQRYMYSHRKELAKEVVYWAETYPSGMHEINDWAHHIYSHKWGGWLDPASFPVSPDEAWEKLGHSIREKGGRHIVSSERFADLLPLPVGAEMLRFIKETVSPATVKVIGYVRRQDDLIESHIKELVKGGNLKKSINDYLAHLPSFVSFDKSFLNTADSLGVENVVVRIYERSRLAGGDVVTDFLKACNIPEVADPRQAETLANPSLNTLSGKVLSDPRIVSAFNQHPYRAHFVTELLNRERFKRLDRFALLSVETRSQLMARFAEGNALLIKAFLNDTDARALELDTASVRPSFAENDLILSYDDLVELLLELRPPALAKAGPEGD